MVLMTVATFVVAGAAVIQIWEFTGQEHKQLRAYVGVKPAAGQFTLSPGVILKQPFIIKNFGVSPASNVREDSAVVMLPYPLATSLKMGKQLPGAAISKITVFPFTATSLHALTDADINNIVEGTKVRLYVVASITYDDIFGEHHFTHVCAMYGGGETVITYCDRFNDTDDDTN